ncbi:MAG: hypothetical protein ACOYYS_05035 [Chloroflexota bacterium]
MSSYSNRSSPGAVLQEVLFRRAIMFGGMIFLALLAFEVFNYSTTEFALNDVMGNLRFAGIRWATILAIAFCCIDFAGVARLFTPQRGADEPAEVWYLFAAWLLAAGMNALLTWWGISVAIANHQSMGGAVVDQAILLKVVPVFVAIMVWLTRVLIIGTFSIAGERLFGMFAAGRQRSQPGRAPAPKAVPRNSVQPVSFGRPINSVMNAAARHTGAGAEKKTGFRPAPKAPPPPPEEPEEDYTSGYLEPTYHPLAASSNNRNTATRR